MKKIALVYNPVSGLGTFKKRLDYIIDAFQRRKMLIVPYRTQKDNKEDFDAFLDAAEPDGVIAAGGDGTLSEVVNLMMKRKKPLPMGIIGSGTSNDFATYLQINEDLEGYFDAICEGNTRFIDLGKVGERYFINVASAGSFSSVAHEVAPRMKNSLGKIAYYIKGLEKLPKLKAIPLHIEASGEVYEEDVLLFVVINGPTVGSMKNVASKAQIDDGKLDFLAVKKCGLKDFMKIFKNLLKGAPIDDKEKVLHIASDNFYISSAESVISDLDGEEGPALPLNISVVHNALEVYVMK